MSVADPIGRGRDFARLSGTALVVAALLLVVLILLVSAHIRLSTTGIGCTPRPECYPRMEAPAGVAAALETPRLVHRGAAMLLAVVILAIFGLGAREGRQLPIGIARPTALLVCTLLLAALGRITPNLHLPAVTLGNVGGGLLLALLLYSLLLDLAPPRSGRSARAHPLVRWGLPAAVAWLMLTGVWASANLAAATCGTGIICDGAGAVTPAALLDLGRDLAHGATLPPPADPAAPGIITLHRLSGLLVVPLLLLAVAGRWRQQPAAASLLLLLLVANPLLSFATNGSTSALWAADLHRLLSLATLLAAAHVAWR